MDEEEIRLTKQRKAAPRSSLFYCRSRLLSFSLFVLRIDDSSSRQTAARCHSRCSRKSKSQIAHFDFQHRCRYSETTKIYSIPSDFGSTSTRPSYRLDWFLLDYRSTTCFGICHSSKLPFWSNSSTSTERTREWSVNSGSPSRSSHSSARIDSRRKWTFARASQFVPDSRFSRFRSRMGERSTFTLTRLSGDLRNELSYWSSRSSYPYSSNWRRGDATILPRHRWSTHDYLFTQLCHWTIFYRCVFPCDNLPIFFHRVRSFNCGYYSGNRWRHDSVRGCRRR